MSRLVRTHFAVAVILGAAPGAPSQRPDVARGHDGYYSAAYRVDVSAPVSGDVVVAGREVTRERAA